MNKYHVIALKSCHGPMIVREIAEKFPKNTICWCGTFNNVGIAFCAFNEREFMKNASSLIEYCCCRFNSVTVTEVSSENRYIIDYKKLSGHPTDWTLVAADNTRKLYIFDQGKAEASEDDVHDDYLGPDYTYDGTDECIRAIRFDGDANIDEIEDFIGESLDPDPDFSNLYYFGPHSARLILRPGRWIMVNAKGEMNVIEDKDFRGKYKKVVKEK